MTRQLPPLFLVDQDREFFSVEGPMTGNRPWQACARDARDNGRKIVCDLPAPDRAALTDEYRCVRRFADVPPGNIVRARR